MASLVFHHEQINAETAARLMDICPFGALTYENNRLAANAACKMCKLCVKQSGGAITLAENTRESVDKSAWSGVAVFADFANGRLHPVTLELLGKARELAAVTGQPVYSLLIGQDTDAACESLLCHGADKVFVYDAAVFRHFAVDIYANAFEDFIRTVKPSSILVGATNLGRSLAPRVAARFETGLTADCTVLEMEPNTDLVQIRPAFGGNIMARIVTPYTRPQFCTVRYKVFAKAAQSEKRGERVAMALPQEALASRIHVQDIHVKPPEEDICDAEVIVALGRGVKSEAELAMATELATLLNAHLACTRPLVEAGRFDAKKQIGLSGRTVKPKLIITLGISGAVQFAAGMRSADCIVAINNDKDAPIFDVAQYCLVGDVCEILPALLAQIRANANA